MSDERKRLQDELATTRLRYQRARYHLKTANSEQKEADARAEFKAASIALTKARRAYLRSP